MSRVNYFLITSIIFITVIFTQDTPKPSLQIDADSTKKTPVVTVDVEEEKDKSKLPAFEELVEEYEKISGLFDMYWDKEKNAAYFSIHPNQFEQIYLWNVTRQSGDAASHLRRSDGLDALGSVSGGVGGSLPFVSAELAGPGGGQPSLRHHEPEPSTIPSPDHYGRKRTREPWAATA